MSSAGCEYSDIKSRVCEQHRWISSVVQPSGAAALTSFQWENTTDCHTICLSSSPYPCNASSHTEILLCVLQAGKWCWKPSMHSRLTRRSSKRQWPKVSVLLFVCFCCCLFFSDCWLHLSEFWITDVSVNLYVLQVLWSICWTSSVIAHTPRFAHRLQSSSQRWLQTSWLGQRSDWS